MSKKRALAHLGFRQDEEWRDWPNLPTVLIDDIAGRLLRYDVAEYLRLRAACKERRACTADPATVGDLDSRFRPRHWNMISSSSQPQDARRQFINTSTGACAHVHLPELSGHILETYTQGLLLLWRLENKEEEEAAVHVRLLNPLTRALTDLPPITVARRSMYVAWKFPPTSRLVYAGISDETSPPTVVLFMSSSMCSCIAYAKPGDQRWALMDKECWKFVPTMNSSKDKLLIYIHYFSVLTMRGCIYLPTKYGNILKVSIHPKPQLLPVVVNQPFDVCPPNIISYLVPPASDEDDTVLMVRYYHSLGHLSLAEQKKMKRRKDVIKVPISARRYSWHLLQVFKVDLTGGRLVPVVDIGRRALFIGDIACLSISTETFPSVAGNAVYLGAKSICSTYFGVRYLLDRTIDPPFKFALQAGEKKPFHQRKKENKPFNFSGCDLKPSERKIVLPLARPCTLQEYLVAYTGIRGGINDLS